MSAPITPDDIDGIIHERVRLAIVSTLAVVPEMGFTELKKTLNLTDGNLSAHSRTLEDAGYLAITKSFRGRRPYTELRLTPKGQVAFQRYLTTLRSMVDRMSKPPQPDKDLGQ